MNGSFAENIKWKEGRPPHDIDVVSFLEKPLKLKKNATFIFDHTYVKSTFNVDAYTVNIPVQRPKVTVKDLFEWHQWYAERIVYWGYWWSHTRQHQEKGFLHIPLSLKEDNEASNLLKIKEKGAN